MIESRFRDTMSGDKEHPSMLSRLPLGSLVTIFILTFAVWIFFYAMNMPLQAPATTVVAAVMIGIVTAARWVWSRSRAKGARN
jgi:RsiW-degrading membrane proteinase PrsW (M82 family)